jgi:hypothetical protein
MTTFPRPPERVIEHHPQRRRRTASDEGPDSPPNAAVRPAAPVDWRTAVYRGRVSNIEQADAIASAAADAERYAHHAIALREALPRPVRRDSHRRRAARS